MTTRAADQVTTEFLQKFGEAWNRHDVDDLMSFMADECTFQLSSGPDVDGARYDGRDAVRASYQAVLDAFPDGHWGDDSHFVAGDRGVSEWTFTATGQDGSRIEVRGCDVFTFRDGEIAVKNSFRKNRLQ
jgi:steroid delta-isomerase-like uncharacterized protein